MYFLGSLLFLLSLLSFSLGAPVTQPETRSHERNANASVVAEPRKVRFRGYIDDELLEVVKKSDAIIVSLIVARGLAAGSDVHVKARGWLEDILKIINHDQLPTIPIVARDAERGDKDLVIESRTTDLEQFLFVAWYQLGLIIRSAKTRRDAILSTAVDLASRGWLDDVLEVVTSLEPIVAPLIGARDTKTVVELEGKPIAVKARSCIQLFDFFFPDPELIMKKFSAKTSRYRESGTPASDVVSRQDFKDIQRAVYMLNPCFGSSSHHSKRR